MSDDLVVFLRARLDEVEADAQKASGNDWLSGINMVFSEDMHIADCDSVRTAYHIARHDPARVLREVEAKRAILAAYEVEGMQPVHRPDPEVLSLIEARLNALEDAVLALAAVWNDHPDYLQEWAS